MYRFYVINTSNSHHPRRVVLRVHCVPGMVSRALCGLSHLSITMWRGRSYYPHLTGEELRPKEVG